MATTDHILLRTGLQLSEVAQRLAAALDLTSSPGKGDAFVVGGRIPGGPIYSGGLLSANYLGNEPGEPSALDAYDIAWAIRTTDRSTERVHSESHRLFAMVTERLSWPALLLHNSTWLVAVWSPQHGRHDFPEHTSPDRPHQHIWEPYIPPRW
jgi:hypothetical protein